MASARRPRPPTPRTWRRWRRSRLAVLAAMAGSLAGAACDGGQRHDRPGTGEPELTEGGTVVVAASASPTTVFPPLAAAALDFELGTALYPGLNYGRWEGGQLEFPRSHPLAVARDYFVEDETLTYRLDTSRSWSDSVPITAADVVFTFDLLRNNALPLSFVTARMDSVVAVNDSTVRFHFERAYPGMLFDTGVGLLPQHAYGGRTVEELQTLLSQVSRDEPLIVSGSFNLAEWSAGERVVLEGNPTGVPSPRLDRVVVRVIPDETARRSALRSGEVHLIQLEEFQGIDRLRTAGFDLHRIPQRGYDFIAWNPAAHRALASVSVRRALSLAIDRQGILETLGMSDYAEPAFGPYGSLLRDLAPAPPATGLTNVPVARELLDEAGWVDRDGDGVREAEDGRRLALELQTSAGNARREDAAALIARQFGQIGVDLEVRTREHASLFAEARRREYEAVFLGWQVGLDPDISFFWADPGSPVNLVAYDVPEVTALIDSATSAATAAAARPYWRGAAHAIAEDYPYAFLWYFDQLLASSPRVGGIKVGVTGFAQNLHEWGLTREAAP